MVNQRTFEKGEGTRTDLLESTASFSLAEAKVIEAQDNLENAKRKLEAMLGEPIKSTKKLKNFRVASRFNQSFRSHLKIGKRLPWVAIRSEPQCYISN